MYSELGDGDTEGLMLGENDGLTLGLKDALGL